MGTSERKRPKRLWVAAILNFLVGVLAIGLVAFLFMSSRVPVALRPSGVAAVFAVGAPCFLIVASAIALLGKPYGRYLLLAAALVFFGTLTVQNVLLIGSANNALGHGAASKVVANAVRASIELAINLWALLSTKTSQYFGGAAVAP